MEHINTFFRHPAGESGGSHKHTSWTSCWRVIWYKQTHFVDILHSSKEEHKNTTCGCPTEESIGTHTHFVDILHESQAEHINTFCGYPA